MSFGYADKPKWGLFNPARSLFATDASLYGSLYATEKRPGKAWNPNANAAGFGDTENSVAAETADIVAKGAIAVTGTTGAVLGFVAGSMMGNPWKGLLIGGVLLPLMVKLVTR